MAFPHKIVQGSADRITAVASKGVKASFHTWQLGDLAPVWTDGLWQKFLDSSLMMDDSLEAAYEKGSLQTVDVLRIKRAKEGDEIWTLFSKASGFYTPIRIRDHDLEVQGHCSFGSDRKTTIGFTQTGSLVYFVVAWGTLSPQQFFSYWRNPIRRIIQYRLAGCIDVNHLGKLLEYFPMVCCYRMIADEESGDGANEESTRTHNP